MSTQNTNSRPQFVGVISDTHGLLRPEAVKALEGSSLILHAGDIGSVDIIRELESIAPVTAVRGNMDWESPVREFQLTEAVEQGGYIFYVLHDLTRLDLDPAAAQFSAVIHGHTHRPAIDWKDGVLYLNPGSAGPERRHRPTTVARVVFDDNGLKPSIVQLI